MLPVSKGLEMWVCSSKTVVKSLIHAQDISKEKFKGKSRTVNLPGVTVTIDDMLNALEAIGGKEMLKMVEESETTRSKGSCQVGPKGSILYGLDRWDL